MTERTFPGASLETTRPRKRWIGIGGALALVALTAVMIGIGSADPKTDPSHASARHSLGVTSSPPGASVYLDGEPTGRKTPAVFESLSSDEPIEVRVMLNGYRSLSSSCVAGAACDFHLVRSTGSLAIEGLPPEARMFVDGLEVPASAKLDLAVGRRVLRIERADELIFEGAVDIELTGSVLRLREGG